MKKQNIIDLAAYRDEIGEKTSEAMEVISPSRMSEELKTAIETLIDVLRTQKDGIKTS